LTYYEIDPLVARIAENQRYFTLLEQCAPQAKIELGDARLKLRDAPDSKYDLIAIDAFGGDSIPIHLLTKEALALYMSKLAPDGILAFHISNRYVQLEPILGDLAHDMHLVCMVETDVTFIPSEIAEGTLGSKWVVMARNQSDLGGLTTDTSPRSHWVPLGSRVESVVWTDDYSDLLGVIDWKGLLKGAN
jgi:spermidine synthase